LRQRDLQGLFSHMETPPPLVATTHPAPSTPRAPSVSESERSWCIGLHLSGLSGLLLGVALAHVIAPLVIWLLKRADSPVIDAAGKEVMNFQISFSIFFAIAGCLCWISTLLCLLLVGLVLLPLAITLLFVVFVVWLFCMIIAVVKTSNGETYRYPFTIRFLR